MIGDTTNVAARVEQLTNTTGDAILLTDQCAEALASRPPGLIERASHALKGKSAAVQVLWPRSGDPFVNLISRAEKCDGYRTAVRDAENVTFCDSDGKPLRERLRYPP